MQSSWIADKKVDWVRHEIHHQGKVEAVEPKLCAVLKVLVNAQGEIVSQQELLDQVWQGTLVANNTVQRCIAQLRKLFDDSAKKQLVIKTHPKLGYSINPVCLNAPEPLQLTIADKNEAANNKKSKEIRPFIYLALLFVFLVPTTIFYWLDGTHSPISYSKQYFSSIEPIDIQMSKISSVTASDDLSKLAYTKKVKDGRWQLIIKNRFNESVTNYLFDGEILGKVSFSSPTTVLLSKVKHFRAGKCSEIIEFDLINKFESVLMGCTQFFNHSAVVFDDEHIIFEQQDKLRQSSLLLWNSKTQQMKAVVTDNVSNWAFGKTKKTLAYVSEPENKIVELTFKDNHQLLRKSNYTAPHIINSVSFTPTHQLIAASRNSIYLFNEGEVIEHQHLDTGSIRQVLSLTDDSVVLLISSPMQQVVWEQAAKTEKVGTQSSYNHHAHLKPNTEFMSFLSNKSGSSQIWLRRGDNEYRLTNHPRVIDDYIWSLSGDTLFFLSDNHIWKTNLISPPEKLELSFDVKRLLQFTSSNQMLILNSGKEDNYQVSEVSINQLSDEVVHEGDIEWAQKINDMLLFNDRAGKVFSLDLNSGHIQSFQPYEQFRLQSEMLAIDDRFYVQDKQCNIWRFKPNQQPEIYDKYTEETPFLTDYVPQTKSKMANGFHSSTDKLLLLKTTEF
ncbi:winged helix-turn-helix domain-containing protein [Shewanella sp. 202IG2-18]|uniref:winged helix-turn-helix domain-containing protein n=1 Tax=Parashewanella hymeniacidonis TaxID=2807618 RepID=UPI00195F7A29|nr:winged helix-turn-helix domain-containing protein [Parashewanella hymeniacidonis]MBM7074198.1 winged helix-turn-helix domain-containing protein [Parashewanella hymeniacidonis]